jgi:hypothetical protein
MKIFISWSGNQSQAIGKALSDWIPNVLQSVEPWISTENLKKGMRWAEELFKVLENSRVGIFCLTPSNVTSPWIAFEAAACSTKVAGKVYTLLYGLKSADITGPLIAFNHTLIEKDDVFRLMRDLNSELDMPLKDEQLKNAFEMWWPKLEESLDCIPEELNEELLVKRNSNEMVAENLELARNISTQVETLKSLVISSNVNSTSQNKNLSRDMFIRINGKQELVRSVTYPIDLNEIGIQVADILRTKYERNYFSHKDEDYPSDEGVAEVEVGQLIYHFSYVHKQRENTSMWRDFYVNLNGNNSTIWHSSTNIDGRG